MLKEYRLKRLAEGRAEATCNRELSILRIALNLGRKCTPPKVSTIPYFPMVREECACQGVLTDQQYSKLRDALPDYLKPLFVVVERFGYSTREAGFLVLAALHSGYFLRRQYCAYLGVGFGYPDDVLTSKLLRLGHAREVSLFYGRKLYRIHSKPIYAALGAADNRNRRMHNPETIQARLMGLDYALSRPDATWYPTETDRVSLFTDQLGISKQHLPTRRYASRNGARATFRYFVDRPPMITLPGDTTVHFCFADPGYHTGDGFISFLDDYRPLLSRVDRSHVIYLAPTPSRSIEREAFSNDGFLRRELRRLIPFCPTSSSILSIAVNTKRRVWPVLTCSD
jgi:hypothetical protein